MPRRCPKMPTDSERDSNFIPRENQCIRTHQRRAERAHSESCWWGLINSMSGENDQMCWRAWHQTIPSSHRVQDSVTRSDEAPLPSSVRESLNSLADFYSKVYSEQPVPAWSTDAAAPPP